MVIKKTITLIFFIIFLSNYAFASEKIANFICKEKSPNGSIWTHDLKIDLNKMIIVWNLTYPITIVNDREIKGARVHSDGVTREVIFNRYTGSFDHVYWGNQIGDQIRVRTMSRKKIEGKIF